LKQQKKGKTTQVKERERKEKNRKQGEELKMKKAREPLIRPQRVWIGLKKEERFKMLHQMIYSTLKVKRSAPEVSRRIKQSVKSLKNIEIESGKTLWPQKSLLSKPTKIFKKKRKRYKKKDIRKKIKKKYEGMKE
jgi:hypothetical protein